MVVASAARSPLRVVVIDGDTARAERVVQGLRGRHYDAVGFSSAATGLHALEDRDADLVLADLRLPEFRDPGRLQRVSDHHPELLVVLIASHDDTDRAVQAVRDGAADLVLEPFTLDSLVVVLDRALRDRTMQRELARLRNKLKQRNELTLVAHGPAMRRTLELAREAVRSTASVLITGEPGTGKAVVARWIHERARRPGPLVQVSCELLPAAAAEVALFGADGAGGHVAQAAGGTLLLDEVFALPVEIQASLLRLVQPAPAAPHAARVILSTERASDEPWRERAPDRMSLPEALEARGALHIRVPPLRERVEDIPGLVKLFLAEAVRPPHEPIGIDDDAMQWLARGDWPGNARELAGVIERACALAERPTLGIDDLTAARNPVQRPESISDLMGIAVERRLSLAEIELGYIKRVLTHTGNNMTRAAQILGIGRRTLYRKLASSH